jgi:hypothetical protein
VTTPTDLEAGKGAESELMRPPRGKSPSLRPALVVLACAAIVTFGGVAVALVGSFQSSPPTVSGLGTPVPGVSLTAIDATGVLQRIASGGTPPADILGALVVPDGAKIGSTTTEDAGVDQYDRSISFQILTTSPQLLKFYTTALKRDRWSLLGTYAIAGQGTEILAQRAGSDGYEWEVGVLVKPDNPAISPSLAGDGQTSAEMRLTLRLFEVSDGS